MRLLLRILLVGATALAACGGDDEQTGTRDGPTSIDAPTVDGRPPVDAPTDAAVACPARLNPMNDGSTGAAQTLVISEINPGEYIEVYNNSGASMNLANVDFQFCSPLTYAAVRTLSGAGTLAAGGYATLGWPAGFADTDAGGEVILFATSEFTVDARIMDFVCWGTNPHQSRKAQAEAVGKWSGNCAGALTMGAIHRRPNTTGTTAASYDVTAPPSAVTCTPN